MQPAHSDWVLRRKEEIGGIIVCSRGSLSQRGVCYVVLGDGMAWWSRTHPRVHRLQVRGLTGLSSLQHPPAGPPKVALHVVCGLSEHSRPN